MRASRNTKTPDGTLSPRSCAICGTALPARGLNNSHFCAACIYSYYERCFWHLTTHLFEHSLFGVSQEARGELVEQARRVARNEMFKLNICAHLAHTAKVDSSAKRIDQESKMVCKSLDYWRKTFGSRLKKERNRNSKSSLSLPAFIEFPFLLVKTVELRRLARRYFMRQRKVAWRETNRLDLSSLTYYQREMLRYGEELYIESNLMLMCILRGVLEAWLTDRTLDEVLEDSVRRAKAYMLEVPIAIELEKALRGNEELVSREDSAAKATRWAAARLSFSNTRLAKAMAVTSDNWLRGLIDSLPASLLIAADTREPDEPLNPGSGAKSLISRVSSDLEMEQPLEAKHDDLCARRLRRRAENNDHNALLGQSCRKTPPNLEDMLASRTREFELREEVGLLFKELPTIAAKAYLTKRERELFDYLWLNPGASGCDIAKRLNVTEGNANVTRHHLFKKIRLAVGA